MANQVILTVTAGPGKGQKFVFSEATICSIGRGHDCTLALPDPTLTLSRRHCVLVIAPPDVWVRDLGSRNGTWVNGQNVGQRLLTGRTDAADSQSLPERRLCDGDQIQVGPTLFEVAIVEAPEDRTFVDEYNPLEEAALASSSWS